MKQRAFTGLICLGDPEQGTPLHEVQATLGHANAATTAVSGIEEVIEQAGERGAWSGWNLRNRARPGEVNWA